MSRITGQGAFLSTLRSLALDRHTVSLTKNRLLDRSEKDEGVLMGGWGFKGEGTTEMHTEKRGVCRSDDPKMRVVIVLIIYKSAAEKIHFGLTRVFCSFF